jgi:hypothetical protein
MNEGHSALLGVDLLRRYVPGLRGARHHQRDASVHMDGGQLSRAL